MRDSLKHDKMTRTLEEHFNDVYGHACGDQAVFCVAKAIEGAVPDGAAAIRYGDDEFLVVRPPAEGEESVNAYVAEVDQKMYREKRKKGWTYRKE